MLPVFSSVSFTLVWSGSDSTGSGIATYDIYVSRDGGAYTPYLRNTTETSTTYTGTAGHTYRFYSIATDNVGNVQDTPSAAQASTTTLPTGFTFQDTTLTVTGTVDSDTFQFVAGSVYTVTLNGVSVQVPPTSVTSIVFVGNGGNDMAYLYGRSTGADTLALKPDEGKFYWTNFALSLNAISTIQAHGKSGDTAYLYDTSGQNTFVATPSYGWFAGAGFYNQEVGFSAVNAFGAAGTNDTAYLYDGGGDNVFVGTPTYSFMTGTGYYYYSQPVGFKAVNSYASKNAADYSYLFDNGGSNTFVATPTYSYLQGSGYFVQAVGFQSVTATSAANATDVSYMFGNTNGGNVFTSNPSYGYMYGTGFVNEAIGFKSVTATGSKTDTASLYDGLGTNVFSGQGSSGSFVNGGLSYDMIGFGYLNIVSSNGTNDEASESSITYTLTKYGIWH